MALCSGGLARRCFRRNLARLDRGRSAAILSKRRLATNDRKWRIPSVAPKSASLKRYRSPHCSQSPDARSCRKCRALNMSTSPAVKRSSGHSCCSGAMIPNNVGARGPALRGRIRWRTDVVGSSQLSWKNSGLRAETLAGARGLGFGNAYCPPFSYIDAESNEAEKPPTPTKSMTVSLVTATP